MEKGSRKLNSNGTISAEFFDQSQERINWGDLSVDLDIEVGRKINFSDVKTSIMSGHDRGFIHL